MLFERYKRPDILKEETRGGNYENYWGGFKIEPSGEGIIIKLDPDFNKDEMAEVLRQDPARAENEFFGDGPGMSGFQQSGGMFVNGVALSDDADIIITLDGSMDDEGDVMPYDGGFHYAGYMLRSFIEKLIEDGEVYFDNAGVTAREAE